MEAVPTIGFLGLAIHDYKGLGTASLPILMNLNFMGTSGFDREARSGFSIGGGIQYSKTELYGLKTAYKEKGVSRSFFPTYVVQAMGGFGLQGFSIGIFTRYGFHPDNDASTLSIGFQWDFNLPKLRKIKVKESEL